MVKILLSVLQEQLTVYEENGVRFHLEFHVSSFLVTLKFQYIVNKKKTIKKTFLEKTIFFYKKPSEK